MREVGVDSEDLLRDPLHMAVGWTKVALTMKAGNQVKPMAVVLVAQGETPSLPL